MSFYCSMCAKRWGSRLASQPCISYSVCSHNIKQTLANLPFSLPVFTCVIINCTYFLFALIRLMYLTLCFLRSSQTTPPSVPYLSLPNHVVYIILLWICLCLVVLFLDPGFAYNALFTDCLTHSLCFCFDLAWQSGFKAASTKYCENHPLRFISLRVAVLLQQKKEQMCEPTSPEALCQILTKRHTLFLSLFSFGLFTAFCF